MKYKKPRTLNWVSIGLVLLLGLGVYLGYHLWPVYTSASRAKAILWDHIPALYKANLRGNDLAVSMIEDIKTSIGVELAKAGINDKAAKVFVSRDPKEIALEVRFKAKAHFPFPDRTFTFELSPKVVSDAARIDW